MADAPIGGQVDQHQEGPHHAADLPFNVENVEPQPEGNENNDTRQPQDEPQRKRRRVSRPKGQAPARRSYRLAGRPPADPLQIVAPADVVPQVVPAEVFPQMAPNEVVAQEAAAEVAPQVAPIVQEILVPIEEVLQAIVPAAVAPALAPAVVVADVDAVAPDVIDNNADEEQMEVDQQQDLPVVHTVPLTRRQQRHLAATGGWQAFLTPLPQDLPADKLGPRKAARVCRAKNRYLAVALRPNLCD
jgi:hypothetical protein